MKTCSVENCVNPVWGKGYCRNHQWKRVDNKKARRIIQKSAEKKSRIPDFGFDNQTDLFAWLWDEAKDKNGIVICPYTDEKLNRFYNKEMWFQCFAHLLPKGRYTYFKLNPKNIRVVFPDFHKIIDQGTYLDRINHPLWNFSEWDAEVETMKIQYQQFKKTNLLA